MRNRAPVLTTPVSDAAKTAIFSEIQTLQDTYLDKYVTAFLEENDIKNKYESQKHRKIRLITFGVFALILLIAIFYRALYHKSLIALVIIAAVVGAVILFRHTSMKKYLIGEIKKRPDDLIDNVLSSQISGSRRRLTGTLIGVGMIAVVLIFSAFFFFTPRIIYERNALGGYSIRYYTLSLMEEKHIVLPETHNGLPVNEIRGEVFCYMNFVSIELPSGITEIRGNTFENCRNLQTIRIPDGVTRIGGHAFAGCSSLYNVDVPDTVNEIGSSAFRYCSSLKTIYIPQSAKINERAFKDSPTQIIRY